MYTAYLSKKPFVIRYPRGNAESTDWHKPMEKIEIGKGEQIRKGKDIAILSFGPLGNSALKAANEFAKLKGKEVSVFNMRYVKPLDNELLHTIFKTYSQIITVEDGVLTGGFGSAIIEFACENSYTSKVVRLGIPDEFITHGTQEELYKICGNDYESILSNLENL